MPSEILNTTYGGGNITGAVSGWCTSCSISQEIEYEDQIWGVPLTLQKRYVKMTRTTMSATVKVQGPPTLVPKGTNDGSAALTFTNRDVTYTVTGYITAFSSQAGEGNWATTQITVVQYN